MKITSDSFNDNTIFPEKFTHGKNPPLNIAEVPANAKSLAIVFHDPDAVSGDYIHWILWNIDPATTDIFTGEIPPEALEGITSAGLPGYANPSPPKGSGRHRYIFEVHALDDDLKLPANSFYADVIDEIKRHSIDYAMLTGTIDTSS